MTHLVRGLARSGARTGCVTAGAFAIAAAAGSLAWGSTSETVVFLASNRGQDVTPAQCVARGGCGPEVTAPVVLAARQQYVIRVSGTVAVWNIWGRESCGKPETRPEFPTSSPTTPTSDDAQFRFAIHRLHPGGHCRSIPFTMPLFQINLGAGWFHPIAVGDPSRPSADHGGEQHPYDFRVTGAGVAPRFRFDDNHPSDNNGQFRIAISSQS
jgi:hypothetical protein